MTVSAQKSVIMLDYSAITVTVAVHLIYEIPLGHIE